MVIRALAVKSGSDGAHRETEISVSMAVNPKPHSQVPVQISKNRSAFRAIRKMLQKLLVQRHPFAEPLARLGHCRCHSPSLALAHDPSVTARKMLAIPVMAKTKRICYSPENGRVTKANRPFSAY